MKIAVCVKQVPESQAKKLDAATKRLDRSGEGTLNSFDANAVEEALRLKEAAGDGEVVLVSLGPDKALEREGAALVLFGQQAGDSDGAVLWAAVADRLRRPVVSQAAELTLSDGKVRVKRQTEFGYDVIDAPLPAVVAVSDAINEPRYPSLKGIMGAKKKPQESIGTGELGLDASQVGQAGSKTEVLALGDPPARGETVKIEDDGSSAEKIVEFLAEKRLL